MHTRTHAQTHTPTHTDSLHAYMYAYMDTYVHMCAFVRLCVRACVRTCVNMAPCTHASGCSHLRTISLVPCSYRDAPCVAPSRVGAHGRAVSTQSTQRDCPSVASEGAPPCEYSRVLRGCRVQVRCGDGCPRGAQRGTHGGERAARRGAGGAHGGECAARRAVRPL
jgi:hypothetical protein